MKSKAYSKFKKTISRCETLVGTYNMLTELNGQLESDGEELRVPAPKDIIRGSIVLAVAALDTYVTDVFSEKLVKYLKHYKLDESLIKLLHDAGLDTKEALTLITMDRPYRRIRTLIENHYATYTTQRFEVIDKFFLPFRLKGITKNAEAKSGRSTVLSSVGKLIERRHKIAHDGDYNSHGRLVNIDDKQIKRRIKDLELLVTHMDDIITSRV
jgi:hypothetical protein